MDRPDPAPPPARDRILNAAVHLFHQHGMAATGVNAILEASDTGKSQFYHYFGSKDGLIEAVLDHHRTTEVDRIRTAFSGVGPLRGLERWLDSLRAREVAAEYRGGCPIASMAAEATEDDVAFQDRLALAFDDQFDALADGLAGPCEPRAAEAGSDRVADALGVAMRVLLLVQGGLLLSSTLKEPAFLEEAARSALAACRESAAHHHPS